MVCWSNVECLFIQYNNNCNYQKGKTKFKIKIKKFKIKYRGRGGVRVVLESGLDYVLFWEKGPGFIHVVLF